MSMFRRASKVKKMFKICGFGPTGSGKTIFALTFPRPRYIDMESGTDWYIGRKVIPEQNDDFDLLNTKSAGKVINAIDEIERDLEKDPECIESVVLDPVTVFWDALQEAYLDKMRRKNSDFEIKFQHWKSIKGPYKQAMTTLINLPVNLILIGRESAEYEMKGEKLVQVGTRISTEKDTPYLADIYLRFFTKKDKNGNEIFLTQVEKDRTNLMKKGTIIENLTYQKLRAWADEQGIADGSGEERRVETDKQVTDQDSKVFDEETTNSYESLIYHEKIVPLYEELDWAPGKVKALIEKHGLVSVQTLGKFLSDKVREMRDAKND